MSYRLVLLLALSFQSFNALAANDLDKWNSPDGRQVRTALKNKTTPTTTYKEKPNVVDAEYRSTSNGGKILHRIEHATTESGSKKGVTIEALKQVDKAAVAKKWANELFKGGVRFTGAAFLAEMAVQEMLDSLDWIMGEGGKVQIKNSESYLEQNSPTSCGDSYCYIARGNITSYGSTKKAACSNYLSTVTFDPPLQSLVSVNYESCYIVFMSGGTRYSNQPSLQVYYPSNGSPPPDPKLQSPSKEDMQTKINDYLNNSNNPSKDLLIEEAYKPTGKGYIEWSDDPDSRLEIFGDTPLIANEVYNSDNPVADGLTKETPKIIDGTTIDSETTTDTITDVNESTVTNPDGSTTTTGTHNSSTSDKTEFKLPAFCDYASKLCDWLDWTQEDPQMDEQQEPEVPSDQGIFSRTFDFNFNFSGQCPPNYTFVMNTQYFGGQKTFDLSWLCMIFTFLGYPLVFLSHCLGFWIFYEVAARKEIKW